MAERRTSTAPRGLRAAAWAAAGLLALLVGASPAMAQLTPYQDPPGYPTAWPADASWKSYTAQGQDQNDFLGNGGDGSKGANPTGTADFSSGAANDQPSFLYHSAGGILYFRMRLSGNPESTGPNRPWVNVTWNVLFDIDGDGYKEFVLMLDGDSSSNGNADDIVVIYADTDTQAFDINGASVWRQDSALDGNQANGGTIAAQTPAGNFGRTRAVAIAGGSEWFLDIQVPLAAFNDGAGHSIVASTPFTMSVTTSNSNTDPTQKDLMYEGDLLMDATTKLPGGDTITGDGTLATAPTVVSVTAGACPTPLLEANVLDATRIVSGALADTIASVVFQYSVGSTSGPWTTIGSGSRTATLGRWTYTSWSTAFLPQDLLYVRAVVTDTDTPPNVTASDNQPTLTPSSRTAQVDNTACGSTGVTIAGTAYLDADHDGRLDVGEAGVGTTLYVKLLTAGDFAGPAIAVASADAGSGAYLLGGVPAGTYDLVLDDDATLADVTPSRPAGLIGVEIEDGRRTGVEVAAAPLTGRNFGLYRGMRLRGLVIQDDGGSAGVGSAHDGAAHAGEARLAGVSVTATDGGVLDAAETGGDGAFTLYVPHTATTVTVTASEPTGYRSVSGSAGTSGGAYDLGSDAITLAATAGAERTGLLFGEARESTLAPDGAQAAAPGTAVFYAHRFTAGSHGQATFTVSGSGTAGVALGRVLYRDTNHDGNLDAGELPVSGPVTVTPGEVVSLVLKVLVPPDAPAGAQDHASVAAAFAYAGIGVGTTSTRTDLTTVGAAGGGGLVLAKSADRTTAKPGQAITYTIVYENRGARPLDSLVVYDKTPAFTVFASAAAGTLPTGLTGVAIAAPAVGQPGALEWTFTGTLAPGASGSVTFTVTLE